MRVQTVRTFQQQLKVLHVKNGLPNCPIDRTLRWSHFYKKKKMQSQITIFVESLIKTIQNHGAIPLTQLRVSHVYFISYDVTYFKQHLDYPIRDIKWDYCDIDSRCDKCGTVEQALVYKYDIFDGKAAVRSSVSPTVSPTLNKIFGGRQVQIGEVPWQVNILTPVDYYLSYAVRIGYRYYYSFCGGTVISTTKVISAAHCFMSSEDGSLKSADELLVIAGHSSIRTARQISKLEKYVLHPWVLLSDENNQEKF